MGNELYRKEIEEARSAADESLYFLERVGDYLEDASSKGLLEFLGSLSKNENLEEAQKQLMEAKLKVTELKMKLNQL